MKRYFVPNQKFSTRAKRQRFDNPELQFDYDPVKFSEGPKIKTMKLPPGYRYPVRPAVLKQFIQKLKSIEPFYFFNIYWIRLTNFIDTSYYGTFWWQGMVDLHPYKWDSDRQLFLTLLGRTDDKFPEEGFGSRLIMIESNAYLSWKYEKDLANFTMNNVLMHEIGHSLASMRQERFDENLIEEFAQSYLHDPSRHKELLEYWRESIISTPRLKKHYRDWLKEVTAK